MKVRILSVRDHAGEVEVAFTCIAGSGKAVLQSATRPGLVGAETTVELDIATCLELGRNCGYDVD